jgi:hypothetical protein
MTAEEEYNWELILKAAIPVSMAEAYVFYANISDGWRWLSLAIGLSLAGIIVYLKDRKRSSIFTAIAIVFLVALIVRFLKNFGVF